MSEQSPIHAALNIGPDADLPQRTIDITTVGARSGEPRRIEIWFHQIDGRWYIGGRPPRVRGWYRNLLADPHFTFHLKHGVSADLSATAHPITDPAQREDLFGRMLDGLRQVPAFASRELPPLEGWVTFSPLVEVTFDDAG